jgi:hypothetical protein
MQAIHRWELQPQGEGTLAITEESLEGWLARVLKLRQPKFLDETLMVWLTALKQAVEKS